MTTSPNNNPRLSRTRIVLLGCLFATIVGALGYWWYSTLEWEEKEVDLGYSKEARQNDFLAAEIFLRNHGVKAITIKNLGMLEKHRWRNIELGRSDTIVLINAAKTLTPDRYDSLYEWVGNGGTLITSTRNPFIGSHTKEEDLLLKDFGIIPLGNDKADEPSDFIEQLKKTTEKFGKKKDNTEESKASESDADGSDKKTDENKTNEKKGSPKEEKPENYYRCGLRHSPTEIRFVDESKPLTFDFSHQDGFTYHQYENDISEYGSTEGAADDTKHEEPIIDNETIYTMDELAGESNTEKSDKDATHKNAQEKTKGAEKHLAYFDVGEGSITITSDNYIWSNRRIDCQDHAYALWSLVNPDGRVWFLVNQDAPSIATLIWSHAKYAVLASILALILWLWASGSRFGPIFVVPQQGRRSLAEHIYAGAMLLWRKQQHPQLVKLLREEIFTRLAQHLSADASAQQELEFLHSLTGLSQAEIQQALFTENLVHPQDFTKAIAHLQLIRKYL